MIDQQTHIPIEHFNITIRQSMIDVFLEQIVGPDEIPFKGKETEYYAKRAKIRNEYRAVMREKVRELL